MFNLLGGSSKGSVDNAGRQQASARHQAQQATQARAGRAAGRGSRSISTTKAAGKPRKV